MMELLRKETEESEDKEEYWIEGKQIVLTERTKLKKGTKKKSKSESKSNERLKIPWEELFGESTVNEGNEFEGFVRESGKTVLDLTRCM